MKHFNHVKRKYKHNKLEIILIAPFEKTISN